MQDQKTAQRHAFSDSGFPELLRQRLLLVGQGRDAADNVLGLRLLCLRAPKIVHLRLQFLGRSPASLRCLIERGDCLPDLLHGSGQLGCEA